MRILLTITIAALLSIPAYGQKQQTAKGYVFEDANGNGRRDNGEKGISGAGVTNGRGVVVQTDANGRYELPIGNDNIISVIKPADYSVPLDSNNQPQHFYVHKPLGSPDDGWKFKGVAPTGRLPRSVDFALTYSPEPREFKAFIFGDPHTRTEIMLDFFDKKIVEDAVRLGGRYAFGIGMGDGMDENMDLTPEYSKVLARIGIPWYNVNGNHDTNYDATADSLANESFIANFGPPDYAFNYGNAHILVLDNIIHPDPAGGKYPASGLREDQKEFIANDLRLVPDDKLIIVAAHVPFIRHWHLPGTVDFLFGELERFEHVLLLSAHLHTVQHIYHDAKSGWNGKTPLHEINVGATCGSWYSGFLDGNGIPESRMTDGTPQGYIILNVNGTDYSADYKTAGQPLEHQMLIHNAKVVMQDKHTPSYIVVNYFMGYKDDIVEFRLDGGEWKPMAHTLRTDPSYENMIYRWEMGEEPHPNRWPSYPTISTHIWQARIPVYGVPIGEHKIEIRATDRFGNVHNGTSRYRIEPVNNPNKYP